MNKILKIVRYKLVAIKYSLIHFFIAKTTGKENNLYIRILSLFFLLLIHMSKRSVGSLWSRPSFISWILSSLGSFYNINNLGNPFSVKDNKYNYLHNIEREVISWNKKIIRCFDEGVEGYVTSGGTESNLFLMWTGREFLLKKNKISPILIVSDFTHYSVTKSARILGLETHIINVSKFTWAIDEHVLLEKIEQLLLIGHFSIMLPITIGYSSTGTSDPMRKILHLLKKIKSKYPKVEFYVWVDGAAQGLVKSFLINDFLPLSDSLIQGYIVDFHKMGQSSLPAGIVLYRRELKKLIETQIDYLNELDSTISGSRPGSSILSIWGNIISKTEKSWKNDFRVLELKKRSFIKKLKKIYPNANLISDNFSLTIAVEINESFPRLNRGIEGKFGLVECNINGRKHYKLHFI